MASYLIGDLQGCDAPLGRLLAKIDFSPSRDTLYLLGDLVNRGPASGAVLRRLMAHGDAARCLLGNHDLSLLAIAHGDKAPHRNDTMDDILRAPDREPLLEWLRHRAMALQVHGLLLVHGGLLPQWDAVQALALAGEVESVLRGPDLLVFLAHMYGNQPDRWDDALSGYDRLRVIINVMTRLRICTPDGRMEFSHKGRLEDIPEGYVPWFAVPNRKSADATIICGHWSALGLLAEKNLLALDSGCLWGRRLSAVRLEDRRTFQVTCPKFAD